MTGCELLTRPMRRGRCRKKVDLIRFIQCILVCDGVLALRLSHEVWSLTENGVAFGMKITVRSIENEVEIYQRLCSCRVWVDVTGNTGTWVPPPHGPLICQNPSISESVVGKERKKRESKNQEAATRAKMAWTTNPAKSGFEEASTDPRPSSLPSSLARPRPKPRALTRTD